MNMSYNDTIYIYNPLNLSIEKLRAYNVERYHFPIGILDILVYRLQVEKMYNLTQEDIYRHFEMHNMRTERLREKYNLAIAQLVGSDMIDITSNGIITLTTKGFEAYNNQQYPSIAANLYSAERSNHLAKVAIIAASTFIAAWKETKWGEPQLLNKLDVDEVELVLPVPSTKSSGAGVYEGVSNRVPNGVSDTAKAIYYHIKDNPNISRSELVKLTGISPKNVQKHINRLKELGLIRRIGSTRLGYWEIIE